MIRAVLVLFAVSLWSGNALATKYHVDPAAYGGGTCRAMIKSHDPETLWVGRFVAESDPEIVAVRAVACFTDHTACMTWVTKTSGVRVELIRQAGCHKGL